MGLTLIRKSTGKPRKTKPKIALVLAGGAVSGGAFKVGGLKALNDYLVGRGVEDLDMYVGLSAGAVLAVPLAAGVGPDEMMKVLDGTSERFDQLRPIDFYQPNWAEFIGRPAKLIYELSTYFPGLALDFVRGVPRLPDTLSDVVPRFFKEPNYTNLEAIALRLMEHASPTREVPLITNHIPSGIFDNSALERWMRRGLERLGIPNDFRAFVSQRERELFLSACNLDTAARVIFGADEHADVTISEAMQASSALPGFFRPARINGVDYVDGGVRNTANIEVAIEKGADLIICYNPFRPFYNQLDPDADTDAYPMKGRYLSDRGMKVVMNQVFRTMLHSRLKLGIQRYLNDDRFQGDIVLLEPQEQEAEFFAMNPLAFWKRSDAIEHGFRSVRNTVEKNYDALDQVFSRYDIEMSRDAALEKAETAHEELGWAQVDAQNERGRSLRLVAT